MTPSGSRKGKGKLIYGFLFCIYNQEVTEKERRKWLVSKLLRG